MSLLDPVMQAFVEAVDKYLQNGVLDAAYNRVMDAVWRNPGDMDAVLRESADLVSKIDTSHLSSKARETATRLVRVERLILDLQLEWRAENASTALAAMNDLTSAELERIAKVFEDNGKSISLRENAAHAVRNSTSVNLTQSMVNRAIAVCGCSYRAIG